MLFRSVHFSVLLILLPTSLTDSGSRRRRSRSGPATQRERVRFAVASPLEPLLSCAVVVCVSIVLEPYPWFPHARLLPNRLLRVSSPMPSAADAEPLLRSPRSLFFSHRRPRVAEHGPPPLYPVPQARVAAPRHPQNRLAWRIPWGSDGPMRESTVGAPDRKSTRLNSSHPV